MARHTNQQHIDPVCGMVVDPVDEALRTRHGDQVFYFCAEGCLTRFQSAPQRYIPDKPKGFWRRYLDRLNKATGGKPPSCCQ